MIRRAVASLVLLGAVTGCTTFSDNDAIARVDDTELSSERLDDLLSIFGTDAAMPAGTGTNANAARTVIGQWIQIAVIENHLEDIGVEVDDAARSAAETTISQDPSVSEISDSALEFLIGAQASFDVFNQLPDPQGSFEGALEIADIQIDPRYGNFDPEFGVVPIGLTPNPGL